jgi:hypothetical protein
LRRLIFTLPDNRITPELLAVDLEVSTLLQKDATDRLKLRAQKYITRFPSSADLWVTYLTLMQEDKSSSSESVWIRARKEAQGSIDDLCIIWEWGVSRIAGGKRANSLYEVRPFALSLHSLG